MCSRRNVGLVDVDSLVVETIEFLLSATKDDGLMEKGRRKVADQLRELVVFPGLVLR